MDALETVKTLITALQSGDMELAANTMTDDFTLQGLAEQTLDRNTFLAVQSALLAAMPDFSYNLASVHESGDRVLALTSITGTQLNELTLPPTLGVPPIPASGLAVTLPQVRTGHLVKDGKVSRMQIEDLPGGGIDGLLQQIATETPLQERITNIGD